MKKKKINIYLILLVLIFCFHLVNNYLLLKSTNSVEGIDVQNHLFFSIEFFHRLSDIMTRPTVYFWVKALNVIQLLNTPAIGGSDGAIYWPNFVNLCASIFYFIFGRSLFAAKLTMLPFFLILIVSTYLIGKKVANRFVGLWAAFLVSMYPIIFESSRQYALDLPLTAMTALTILFLLRCDNFKNRKYAILLGLSFGIGMLVKGQLVLFIIIPLCLVLLNASKDIFFSFKSSSERTPKIFSHRFRMRVLCNIALFIAITTLISSIWWGNKLPGVLWSFKEHAGDPMKIYEGMGLGRIVEYSSGDLYSWHSIEIAKNSAGPFLFLVFFITFIFFIKAKVKYKGILVGWVSFPFLLFSFILLVKQARFLMPLFPGLALISAGGISQIKSWKLKNLSLGIVVIFSLTQFFILSYSAESYRNISIGSISIFGWSRYGDTHYKNFKVLKIDEIVKTIRGASAEKERIKVASIVYDGRRPASFEMLYWLKLKDRFIDPIDLCEMHSYFPENFDSLDFVLFRPSLHSGLVWPEGEKFRQEFKAAYAIKWLDLKRDPGWFKVLEKLEDSRSKFELIRKVEREDGFRCYIYKRR